MNRKDPTDSASLREALPTLARHAAVVAVCVLVGALGALLTRGSSHDEFQSTAVVFEWANPDTTSDEGVSLTQSADRNPVPLQVVADRTAAKLGDVDSATVAGDVDVTSDPSTHLVRITATEAQPARATRVAGAFATEYVALARSLSSSTAERGAARLQGQLAGLTPAERSGPTARALRESIGSLQRRAREPAASAAVLEPAAAPRVAAKGSSRARRILVGAALGLVVGLGLALLLDQLDRRVRDLGTLDAVTSSPRVGTIPASAELRAGAASLEDGAARDAFQLLRASLQHNRAATPHAGGTSVLLASAESGDGRTTIGWHVCAAAAAAGRTAVLVEGDLRRPVLVERYGVPAAPSLSAILDGQAQAPSGAPEGFTAIAAGEVREDPVRLLESDAMAALIAELESSYDLVVIDAPPALEFADCLALATKVAAVVAVVRVGGTRRDGVRRLFEQLELVSAPLAGVVANGVRAGRTTRGGAPDAARKAATPLERV